MVFDDSYEQAWDNAYRGLTPANRYNVDYSMLGTARVEPLLRRIRNAMMDAGMVVEDSKGECNFGQHEINFLYAEALRAADQHVIYKNAAKEMAAQDGKAITFMAKFDEREGNSCHIHLSLRGTDGSIVFDERGGPVRPLPRRHAGGPARADALPRPEHQLLQALRGAARSRPTTVAWGHDNRTCALRVVGHGAGRRIECRVPGADVNPYLALSALIAAGLHGVDAELELEPALEGNAYEATRAPAGARAPCATPATSSRRARSRATRSARRSSTTTSTTRASSSRPTTRRSRTGSASGASSVCRRRLVRRRADPAAARAGSRSPSASPRAPGGPFPRGFPLLQIPHTGQRSYPPLARALHADRHRRFGPSVATDCDREHG